MSLRKRNEEFIRFLEEDPKILRSTRRNFLRPKIPVEQSQDVQEVGDLLNDISLMCPISMRKQRCPARTHVCTHPQTFDALSYFESLVNYSDQLSIATTVKCPVCQKKGKMIRDDMMAKILNDNLSAERVTIDWRGNVKSVDTKSQDSSYIDLVTPVLEKHSRKFSFSRCPENVERKVVIISGKSQSNHRRRPSTVDLTSP